MNANGTLQANLTNNPGNDFDPDLQPIPVTPTLTCQGEPATIQGTTGDDTLSARRAMT